MLPAQFSVRLQVTPAWLLRDVGQKVTRLNEITSSCAGIHVLRNAVPWAPVAGLNPSLAALAARRHAR